MDSAVRGVLQGMASKQGEEEDTTSQEESTPRKIRRADGTSIQSIDTLYRNACKRYHTIPVSKFLRQYPTGVIDLRHYGIGDKGVGALSAALKHGSTITSLGFHDNAIGADGVHALCEMLAVNCGVVKLDLSANAVGRQGAVSIGRMIGDNVYLQNLNLSGCGLQHASELLQAIRYNTSIETLTLTYNELADEGATLIGLVLRDNRTLRYLDISWNNVREKGLRDIVAGLCVNSKLGELDISRNGFGDGGATSLEQALVKNKSLRMLNVSNAFIGARGVTCVARGLKRNKTLHVLKIGGNNILAAAACELLVSIKREEGCSLKELHLDQVVFNGECERALDEVLDVSPGFYCTWDVSIKGGAVSSGKRPALVDVFFSYVNTEGLRLIDLFKILSSNHTELILSKEEFVTGMRKRDFPMNEKQLRTLFDVIDTDQSGSITFQELASTKKDRQGQRRKKGLGRSLVTVFAAMKLKDIL